MPVEVSDRDGVWVLAVRRPPVNAIDLTLVREITERLRDAASSAACRAVVVTGAGNAFCAGIDVRVVPTYDTATRAEMLRGINRMVAALYGLPKPTIAAINGHALGGGLVVALACDVRFAAEGNYKLGLTEVTAGVPFPAGPLAVVRAELDPGTVRVLTLSGLVMQPADPMASRFIDRLLPPDQLLTGAVEHAALAAQATAYAAVKQQVRAATLTAIERVIADDADPLLRVWL